MTPEQRERLASLVAWNQGGNCYLHKSDADAIEAALKRIERLEAALLLARDRLWSFGSCRDQGSDSQRWGNEADNALEGRD